MLTQKLSYSLALWPSVFIVACGESQGLSSPSATNQLLHVFLKTLLQDNLTISMHVPLRMAGHLAGWTLCLAGIPSSSTSCSFLPQSS